MTPKAPRAPKKQNFNYRLTTYFTHVKYQRLIMSKGLLTT